MSNVQTSVIMILGLAIGIIAAVFAGQSIFDAVFKVPHPDTSDHWQNLDTLAIAAILILIAGAVAFGIVGGIFYGTVFALTRQRRRRSSTSRYN